MGFMKKLYTNRQHNTEEDKMALDIDRIRGRQKEIESKKMGNYFKPEAGRNIIRVFTFDHKVTKADVQAGFFPKDKLGKTVTELDRPVTRFFQKGGRPTLCLSQDDPRMVQYREKAARAKTEEQKEALRDFRPQTSYFINVVNMADREKGVVEYASPKTVYQEILQHVLDPDYGEEILGCKGRDFVIEYDKEKEGAAMYSVRIRPQEKSDELPESLEGAAKDFYDEAVLATLGELPATSGAKSEEEEDLDEEDAGDDEEDKDEEEYEEDLESDEEDLDEDDEEDDLDDEEEEAPKKAAKKPEPKGKKHPLAKKK